MIKNINSIPAILATTLVGLSSSFALQAAIADEKVDKSVQEKSEDKEVLALEVITVTSQKRLQSLQDIPSSIKSINGDTLNETGANGMADFLDSVPSLSAVQQGPGQSKIVIRGVSTGGIRNDEPQNKETVGIYLDEIPVAVNGFNPDMGLYDVASVEVLRGPQGTLYGSGSMGGTLRILTNKPESSDFYGSLDTTFSSTHEGGNNTEVKGMLNIPLVEDMVALRVVGYTTDYSGYLDNPVLEIDDFNDAKTDGARIQLGVEFSDNFNANLSYFYHTLETGGKPFDYGDLQRGSRTFDGLEDKVNAYNLLLNYEFDSAMLTSSTSVFKKEGTNPTNAEKLFEDNFGLQINDALIDTSEVDDFTQEIRFLSTNKSDFQWIVGAFFTKRDRIYSQSWFIKDIDAQLGALGEPPSSVFGAPDNNIFFGTQEINQQQIALFSEVSYEMIENVTATLGLRWFDWDMDYEASAAGLLQGGSIERGPINTKESGVTPKVNISYTPDSDTLYYFQAAQGFRLGGVNDSLPVDLCGAELAEFGLSEAPESFESDSLWSYEIGGKADMLDNRLRVNASIYYIDWSDIQTSNGLSCNFSFTDNSGQVISKGVELELEYLAAEGLTFSLGLSNNSSTVQQDNTSVGAVSGDQVPYSPEFTASFSARYEFEVFDGNEGYVRADYQYVGSSDSAYSQSPSVTEVGDYNMVNLRAGINLMGTPLTFAVFVNNLFDERGLLQDKIESSIAPAYTVTNRPRTIGVSVGTTF